MNGYPELSCAVQRYAPDEEGMYSIDVTAHLAGTSRHDILLYCKRGLITPQLDPEYGGYYFDPTAVRTLQRVEYLRGECGINLTGIRMILDLMHEVERLRAMVEP